MTLHTRIKPKYNANPTPREKAYHAWLMEEFACGCGCERESTVVHHPLKRHPDQRWRRDHEFVVPMFWQCHMDLHACGSEETFRPGDDYAAKASGYRAQAYAEGVL